MGSLGGLGGCWKGFGGSWRVLEGSGGVFGGSRNSMSAKGVGGHIFLPRVEKLSFLSLVFEAHILRIVVLVKFQGKLGSRLRK